MLQLAATATPNWKPVLRVLHDTDLIVFVHLEESTSSNRLIPLTVAGKSPYKLS